MSAKNRLFAGLLLAAIVCATTPGTAVAQGKSQKDKGPVLTASASISLTKDMRIEIHDWYSQHPVGNVEALPPGIRMRLARGKPLPPGIAKKVTPAGLKSRIRLPDGYKIMEVGLDVLLVEVGTSIVHDILVDAVR